MTLSNYPKKNKNESQIRYESRIKRLKGIYDNFKGLYKTEKLKFPAQKTGESADAYTDRLFKMYQNRDIIKATAELKANKVDFRPMKKFESKANYTKYLNAVKNMKWQVTYNIYYYVSNGSNNEVVFRDVKDIGDGAERWIKVVTFDQYNKPTKEQIKDKYNEVRDMFEEEFYESATQSYIVAVQRFKGIESLDPVNVTNNDIRNINMYSNVRKTCVIELLHKRYQTPKAELQKFFLDDTSSYRIDAWCKKNDISHYAYDLLNNRVCEYVGTSKKYALMYIIADEHIYEITDPKQRIQMSHTLKEFVKAKRKSTVYTELDTDLFKKVINPTDFKFDTDYYKQLNKLPEGKFYVNGDLTNAFLTIAHEEPRPPRTTASNLDINKIVWGKTTIVKSNPYVIELCKSLDLEYNCQGIADVVLPFVSDKIDISDIESTYNLQTYNQVKQSFAPLHHNFADYTTEQLNNLREEKGRLLNVDIKRCYPYVCMNHSMPTITSRDSFEPFDGKPKPDYWYVIEYLENSPANLLFGSSTFLPYELIIECADNYSITHQIKTTPTDTLKRLYKTLSKNNKHKQVGNYFIGLLARSNKKYSNVIYTYSEKEIGYYAYKTDSKVSYIDLNGKRLYKTISQDNNPLSQFKYRMAYAKILLMSRLYCYQMYKMLESSLRGFKVIKLCVDGALGIFDSKKSQNLKKILSDKKPGDIRKKPIDVFIADIKKSEPIVPNITSVIKIQPIKETDLNTAWDADIIATDLSKLRGALITGGPGTGKTHMLTKLQNKFPAGTVATCTFTRLASTLIPNATSLHEFFDVHTVDKFTVNDNTLRYHRDNLKVLIIDECSQVSSPIYEAVSLLYSVIPNLKVYLFGDFNQNIPINDICTDHDSAVMRVLTCGNQYNLIHQYRSNPKYVGNLLSKNYGDLNFTPDNTPCKFNIAYTNKKCDAVNKRSLEIYPKLNESGAHIRFARTTKVNTDEGIQKIPNSMLAIAEFYDDDVYIKQLYNGQAELAREYIITLADYNKLIEKNNIVPGYCVTAYKSQGITVNIPYNIYEWQHRHFDTRAKYVAASRTTNPSLITVIS